MGALNVTSVTIEEVLGKLRAKEWQIPKFQRDFVWNVSDVIDLVHSIFMARPIGMVTLWEQADESGLEVEPISIIRRRGSDTSDNRLYFTDENIAPRRTYAILDGLQRCTALAMTFGGFRSEDSSLRFAGRYYLDVKSADPLEQIVYVKENEVKSRELDKDAVCFSQGLFPLSTNAPRESMMVQWLRYVQAIRDSGFYTNRVLPDSEELDRRDSLLKLVFEGLSKTKLAVYIVPADYHLANICEIFEKLNTTGTKVSTVDLIHSWMYADTADEKTQSINLREWIDELGQRDGAIGWASSDDRPELVVQMVTACYVALEEKPDPRKFGRGSRGQISSVKASDLLATPTEHWKNMMNNTDQLATYLMDFQLQVAGGLFPWRSCPYPVTAAIYVSLRMHHYLEGHKVNTVWGLDDLNALFKAFFWRNALTSRYDQGFLTQLGTDIKELKTMLMNRAKHSTSSSWAAEVQKLLDKLIAKHPINKDDLSEYLTDGRVVGAFGKALFLPMVATVKNDLLDEKIDISFGRDAIVPQMHHIYPRQWCNNNLIGDLVTVLDKVKAGRDFVNSVSNFMPLSSRSNQQWKSKIPGQVIGELKLSFDHSAEILKSVFIDEKAFRLLESGSDGIPEFWNHRSRLIADDLLDRTVVRVQ